MDRSNSPQGFSIKHVSCRAGYEGEIEWVDVNIVFSVEEECRTVVSGFSQEWTRGVLYEVDEVSDVVNFYANNDGVALHELVHPCLRRGLMTNDDYFLVWLQKFDVYCFREFIEDNAVTRAAINEILELRSGEVRGRFMLISRLMRCLRTLNTFWD